MFFLLNEASLEEPIPAVIQYEHADFFEGQ